MTSTSITVFTEEVNASLTDLRNVIVQCGRRDEDLRQRLSDAMAAVTMRFEEQVMLMFENFAVLDKEQQQQLLQRETHEAIDRARGASWPDVSGTDEAREPNQESEFFDTNQTFPTEVPDAAPTSPQRMKERASRVDKRKTAPLEMAHRHLACGLYLALEALASTVKAERCSLYLHYKTTNVLKSICTVPHNQKKIQVSAHSGLLGLSFTSCVAFNLKLDEGDRITYVKSIDQQLGTITQNILCFPIRNARMQPIGLLELSNKMRGTGSWTELDEGLALHVSPILAYFVSRYDRTDFLNIAAFDPSPSLHTIEPWAPSMEDQHPEIPSDVKSTDGIQLMFRNRSGDELAKSLRAFREQVADKSQSVMPSGSLKEIHSYLMTLEESYRQGLNQYAQLEKDRQKQQEELQRRSHKIRVLEDNVAYLEDIIKELKSHAEAAPQGGGRLRSAVHARVVSTDDHDISKEREGETVTSGRLRGSNRGRSPANETARRVVMVPATRSPFSPSKLPQVQLRKANPDSPLSPATLSRFLRSKVEM
eukprot:GGOE01045593.1.p1 GENE.GGOE01045593.1~~GGOE01045593.1.p1  ORF type:complete len:536 (-),score=184.89 GGOE01045593.1:326-1933(-)